MYGSSATVLTKRGRTTTHPRPPSLRGWGGSGSSSSLACAGTSETRPASGPAMKEGEARSRAVGAEWGSELLASACPSPIVCQCRHLHALASHEQHPEGRASCAVPSTPARRGG